MNTPKQISGLNDEEVQASEKLHGKNTMEKLEKNRFLKVISEVVMEPLFLILVGVAIIYFILEKPNEGFLMIGALLLVSGISVFQESKSRNAVAALKKLSNPKAKVIRNGAPIEILSEDIVVGDILMVSDGSLIQADAMILDAHDFSVNESILTGESLPVAKDQKSENRTIFQGTMVLTGSCIACVTFIGNQTELGKIGRSIQVVENAKTPLQIQLNSFVRYMVYLGIIAFLVVFGINYYISGKFLHALLHGLTLAMSVIPEEIPVALSTFMALGAYRMYKNKVIVRTPVTVETLGAATVICVDKTGTLTENKMELAALYNFKDDKIHDFTKEPFIADPVLEFAMWSSESDPFDNMEKAIHEVYGKVAKTDQRKIYSMVHEYPLGGDPPMMTHVFKSKDNVVIAVKGSVEGILNQSRLNTNEKAHIHEKLNLLTSRGFRILAVAKSNQSINELPVSQQEFEFEFLGLIAFYDPPRNNIGDVIQQFYDAGIKVKMITGDHAQTALSIARQVGMNQDSTVISGAQVMGMNENELDEKVKTTNVFARMFPEAKLKIIEALKRNGEIVAMTGDGVNDGPALKAAHIGIAMGKRGSEVAKNTASLILADDDLIHMTEAVALGRRIYENLKKAIRYIVSIHIPIILIVTIPFLFFDPTLEIFTPVHVIFLELIMGPTCSIIFENEPIEENSMKRKPRISKSSFFTNPELRLSIIQGLMITASCIGAGFFFDGGTGHETLIRTTVFATLIFSNLFLTLVNRSFEFSVLATLKNKNNLVPFILLVSIALLFLSIYWEPMQHIFQFADLTVFQLLFCLLLAFTGVIWIEALKWWNRKNINSTK